MRRCWSTPQLGVLCLAVGVSFSSSVVAQTARPNVLFIAVDDLRPVGSAFDVPAVQMPNIDRLAKSGTAFLHAYCQQALCSPSRTSLLTGRRPDTTRVYDLETHFRTQLPDVVALPQYFKEHGYFTQSLGKIYHLGVDDPKSWSVEPWRPKGSAYGKPETHALIRKEYKRLTKEGLAKGIEPVAKDGKSAKPSNRDAESSAKIRGPAWEDPDISDDKLREGALANKAVETLRSLKDKPFFLAVGFVKPHLPFVAPKKYYDLYPPDSIQLPANLSAPKDGPQIALHASSELRSYLGMPKEKEKFTETQMRELIRGYYATCSYTDAQIGRVLDELDRLGLANNTIVVLWGDHGWHLGEQGLWCKHSNFEVATRTPLVIRVPKQKVPGGKATGLTELVDIYPTLCQLCNLPAPMGLEGLSLVPLLDDPGRSWKKAAFSQYPRNRAMGYSMRTGRYRYTEWSEPGKPAQSIELYDHQTDPAETVNIAKAPENKELVARLGKALHTGWQSVLPNGSADSDPLP